jgi:putative membrane protein
MPDARDDTPVRATDTLANERTYLAYLRTALAFIAFGFVIARFSLFAREFSGLLHGVVPQPGISSAFGAAMAIFGVGLALFASWRYVQTDRGLREGRVVALTPRAGYIMTICVVAIGAVVALALIVYR